MKGKKGNSPSFNVQLNSRLTATFTYVKTDCFYLTGYRHKKSNVKILLLYNFS